MKHLVREQGLDGRIRVESAGTGGWHVGEPPDARSREVGARRGIPLAGRAQQFTAEYFARFDHVLVMDRQNLEDLSAMAPDGRARAKLGLLRSYDPAASAGEADVPDPYHGGAGGFDRVFDICLAACRGFLSALTRPERDGTA